MLPDRNAVTVELINYQASSGTFGAWEEQVGFNPQREQVGKPKAYQLGLALGGKDVIFR